MDVTTSVNKNVTTPDGRSLTKPSSHIPQRPRAWEWREIVDPEYVAAAIENAEGERP